MTDPVFTPAARTDAVAEDGAMPVSVAGRSILLCRSGGGLFAIENICSHAQETLERGRIKHGWIMCPAHGARFDLATGEPLGPPASEPIATFPVRIVDDTVEVAV